MLLAWKCSNRVISTLIKALSSIVLILHQGK